MEISADPKNYYIDIVYNNMPPRRRRVNRFARRSRGRPRAYQPKVALKKVIGTNLHSFKRTQNLYDNTGNITLVGQLAWVNNAMLQFQLNAGAGVNTYGSLGMPFQIQNLPNHTEFTTLFDSYRINKVVVKMYPYSTVNAVSVAGAPNGNPDACGFVHFAIDHDDASAPTADEAGIRDLMQYPSYRRQRVVGTRPVVCVIKPKLAKAVYQSALITAYAEGKREWVDCTYPDVPHYGFKAVFEGVQPNNGASNIYLRAEATYYVTFKGVR